MKNLIILPAYNSLDYTKICIQSILDDFENWEDDPEDLEVVILDDCSSDGTTEFFEILGRGASLFTHIKMEKNMGLTHQWNVGAQHGIAHRFNNLIFLNNDTIVTRGWIQAMEKCLKLDKPGIIGPSSNQPGHQPKQHIGHFVAYKETDNQIQIDSTAMIVGAHPNWYVELPYINGFCMMIPTEAAEANMFDEKNLFNPANRNVGNEDELTERMKKNGYKFYHAVNSFVFHYKDVVLKRNSGGYRGTRVLGSV